MQYSKLVFALPVASAAVLAREADNEAYVTQYQVETQVATVVVTQTGAPVVVTQTAGAEAPAVTADSAPVQYSQVQGHGHGHGHFHSSSAAQDSAPAPSAPAPSVPAPVQPSPPASSAAAPASSAAAAPSSAPASGSASSGGCPADTSGKYLSPGVNGAPQKSMLDSINYIRRMYNQQANCLTWSDSLASASDTCAAAESESHLRMNSDIVSAPGYCTSSWYDGKLASSEFERSMIWMLCQSPSDPELQGTCNGKTGEVGCSGAACTGHHDAIVDKDNTNNFMGCGHSGSGNDWISCSFSKDQNAPAGY